MTPPLKRVKEGSISPERSHSSSSPLSSHGTTADKYSGGKKRGRVESIKGKGGGGGEVKEKVQKKKALGSTSSLSSYVRPLSTKKMEGRGGASTAAAMGDRGGLRGGGMRKKLLIRPFSTPPVLPDEYFKQTWENQLLVAIRAIHNKTSVAFSFEELYQKVEDLCRGKKTDELSAKLRDECDSHIAKQVRSLEDPALDTDAFLVTVDRVWQEHCSELLTIRSIFLFLDRKYVIQTTHTQNLWDMGLQLFEKHLLESPNVLQRIIRGTLRLIAMDQDAEIIDKSLLKRLMNIFTSTKLYASHLEKDLLDSTAEYYRIDSVKKLQEYDIAMYLWYVEKQIGLESERIVRYLNESTRKGLLLVVESNLLASHISVILDKGFNELCSQMKVDDLSLLYRLFERVDSSDSQCNAIVQLGDAYVQWVDSQDQLVMNPEEDESMVQNLLDFMEKCDTICNQAFQSSYITNKAKQALEKLINKRSNKPAELIAKYIDRILKSGNKKYSEDELDSTFDRLMVLFRNVHSKDIFEAFYKRDLSKRLLFDRSASLDLESAVISKLKMECGAGFTRKMEGMFKDVEVSSDIMHSFYETRRNIDVLRGIELKVNILNQLFWPDTNEDCKSSKEGNSKSSDSQKVKIKLPKELFDCEETFKKFHLEKCPRKALSWQYASGQCAVKANFPKRTHVLTVSLYQTLVLLLFNDRDTLRYDELIEGTGLSESELKRTLLSLACGKHRVIIKSPKGPVVNNEDTFTYASGFGKQLVHLKINSIQTQATPEEKKQTTELVFKERIHHIDLAIVRIMKTRRSMTHTELIRELYEQLRFEHQISTLKERIEYLIENMYIERDSEKRYTYLA